MPEPLLVIAGPTASGKSRLGIETAARLGGEIVSADAFAVYRGLNIGTDKPSPEQRRAVTHHLVDVAEPTEVYSAGRFAAEAQAAIAAIRERGSVPIVVGGTHFWIRALLEGLFPAPPSDPAIRQQLNAAWHGSPRAMYDRLGRIDPAAAERIGPGDRQRVVRALEVWEVSGRPISEHWRQHAVSRRYSPIVVAPHHARESLYVKIDMRVDRMFAAGLVAEVEQLLASGVSCDAHALKAIGYRETLAYLAGRCSLDAAKEDTKRASRRFAKRQLSWLRNLREATLHWVPGTGDGGADRVVALWTLHIDTRGR